MPGLDAEGKSEICKGVGARSGRPSQQEGVPIF